MICLNFDCHFRVHYAGDNAKCECSARQNRYDGSYNSIKFDDHTEIEDKEL